MSVKQETESAGARSKLERHGRFVLSARDGEGPG